MELRLYFFFLVGIFLIIYLYFYLVKNWVKEFIKINLKNNFVYMFDDFFGVVDNVKKILFDMKCIIVIDDCNVYLWDVFNLLEDEMYSFRLFFIEVNDLDKLYDIFYYYGKKE